MELFQKLNKNSFAFIKICLQTINRVDVRDLRKDFVSCAAHRFLTGFLSRAAGLSRAVSLFLSRAVSFFLNCAA